MKKILANDGISQSGVNALEAAGYEVITTKVAQEQLENYINEHEITGLLVRSATTVRKDLIDACPSLKLIGRGGVGMDNIDVDYAREKGLKVFNTPESGEFLYHRGSIGKLGLCNGSSFICNVQQDCGSTPSTRQLIK